MSDELDVVAVRARFTALDRPLAFLDGPGGTQVPDCVIDAIAGYLRESNANLGGAFETSRRSEALVNEAHTKAAAFLGCDPTEVGFGANMTSLNFTLTRTFGRTLEPGDEIVVTRLDHDANIAPWLELARDRELVVRHVDFDPDGCRLDLAQLASLLSPRTRVVAVGWASNAVGTITDVARVADLAHAAGAIVWVDAVHYAPHAAIDVRAIGADVLLCSPYKFYGPHLGMFFARRELLEAWRPYKARPAPDDHPAHRLETGTQPHEALAGLVAALDYLEEIGWHAILAHERALAQRFLAGLPPRYRLLGLDAADERTPTFAVVHPGRSSAEIAAHLARRELAVWAGDYYAMEVMQQLGLPDGAVRIGFVHYNTEAEVDRALEALAELS